MADNTFIHHYEHQTRVDLVIPLAMALVDEEALPDAFVGDFADWLFGFESSDAGVQDILSQITGLKDILDRDPHDFDMSQEEDLADWLRRTNRMGFLAKVSTPVRQPVEGLSFFQSWGYIHNTWVYGETMEQVSERALAWAKERHAEDLAPRKAKKQQQGEG